jgi:aldehyde dehydrogenase (NAD+)
MYTIDTIYIDGAFVTPHGTDDLALYNPSTEQQIGTVRLADEVDANAAVAAAKRAFPAFSKTTKAERIAMLTRLAAAVAARGDELGRAMVEEYGAPAAFCGYSGPYSASIFLDTAKALETFEFERRAGSAEVTMVPLGVMAAIIPWNADQIFIATKLATAIAAGCTIVIKPSELSALQTRVMTECLHEAGLPPGVCNIVTGLGQTVGATLSAHPDVAKVSFTGSTGTGRAILHAAADTMTRTTLELGGKGATIVLDDADLDQALPIALGHAYLNSGQACIAGSRLLIPASREADILPRLAAAVAQIKAGDPNDPTVSIGPVVNKRQWDRVQGYIRLGLEEGAKLLAGGEGRPDGVDRGWFVRPTIFVNVKNDMRIAREEIFGPVLSVISYRDEADAIAIANDTHYGLQSYVLSTDVERAKGIARQIETGRVVINQAPHDALAPFGGFKQSGMGRENGVFGIEALMEPRAILA